MLAWLLQKGADPNQLNKFKESPIFIAAENGSMQVLHTLFTDKRTKLAAVFSSWGW